MREYPRLILDLKKLKNNVNAVGELCHKNGITCAVVIKGFNGIEQATKCILDQDVDMIATSRLEQFEEVAGYKPKIPRLMLRIPAISEIDDLLRLTDMSLVSEIDTLKAIEDRIESGKTAIAKGKKRIENGEKYKIILMQDLGDLREGFWDESELVAATRYITSEAKNLELVGIGTNLGCYGSIEATPQKMRELIALAKKLEIVAGKKLQYISGGGSTSLPLVANGKMPSEINMLRIGEGIAIAKDLPNLWDCHIDGLLDDIFMLKAEIIEIKEKPTYPQGNIKCDAFGFTPKYEDEGIRKRALVALGKLDVGYLELIEAEKGIKVVGASSDHTILDIEDAKRDLKVGDIIEFKLKYGAVAFATSRSDIACEIVD